MIVGIAENAANSELCPLVYCGRDSVLSDYYRTSLHLGFLIA
jgi:hypothetical protein